MVNGFSYIYLSKSAVCSSSFKMRMEGVWVSSYCPDLTAHTKHPRKLPATSRLVMIKTNTTLMIPCLLNLIYVPAIALPNRQT